MFYDDKTGEPKSYEIWVKCSGWFAPKFHNRSFTVDIEKEKKGEFHFKESELFQKGI